MTRKPKTRDVKQAHIRKTQPVRPKLDPRLSFILALTQGRLKTLKEWEDQELRRVSQEIQSALETLKQGTEEKYKSKHVEKLQELDNRLFAPLTTGVYFPKSSRKEKSWPVKLREPYVSAFILSDASARDLIRLGVKVRSQVKM